MRSSFKNRTCAARSAINRSVFSFDNSLDFDDGVLRSRSTKTGADFALFMNFNPHRSFSSDSSGERDAPGQW